MAMSLRKYKKIELIDLLIEYETEITNLRVQVSTLQLDMQTREEERELSKMEDLRNRVINKKIDYLINRIRVVSDPTRKLVYINELNRING